jgi:hypothetical protein
MRAILISVIGLLVIVVVGGAFYGYVGVDHPVSSSGEDWSTFGEYFGGVAGPLLSFVSIILLVYTIRLQMQQISEGQGEVLKRDLLAHVTKADDEIERWLQRQLTTVSLSEQTVEFGDVVWGVLQQEQVSPREFKPAVGRLLVLTALYCEAIALYRDNINPYFILRYHKQKAESLLSFISGQSHLVDGMARVSIAMSLHLLNAEVDAAKGGK